MIIVAALCALAILIAAPPLIVGQLCRAAIRHLRRR